MYPDSLNAPQRHRAPGHWAHPRGGVDGRGVPRSEIFSKRGHPTPDEMPAEVMFRMGALMVAAPATRRAALSFLKALGRDEMRKAS